MTNHDHASRSDIVYLPLFDVLCILSMEFLAPVYVSLDFLFSIMLSIHGMHHFPKLMISYFQDSSVILYVCNFQILILSLSVSIMLHQALWTNMILLWIAELLFLKIFFLLPKDLTGLKGANKDRRCEVNIKIHYFTSLGVMLKSDLSEKWWASFTHTEWTLHIRIWC